MIRKQYLRLYGAHLESTILAKFGLVHDTALFNSLMVFNIL